MTFGEATIALNVLFTLLQIPLLRRRFGWAHLLQLPIAVLFGVFIDVSMGLTRWLAPGTYWLQWMAVLAGCVLVALGVVVQFLPRVLLTPGDGLIAALAHSTGVLVGNMKVMFDVALVAIGALLSLVWFGGIEGIREGTVVAMFLVGAMVGRLLPPLDRWFARRMGRPHE